MSSNQFFQINKSKNDITHAVFLNTLKMIQARNLISDQSFLSLSQSILSRISDDLTLTFSFDSPYFDTTKCIIKYIPLKISSVGRSSDIASFLNKHNDSYKFIIVKDINNKSIQYVLNTYNHVEFFLEHQLMFNLIDHHLVPQHILLSPEQEKLVLDKYNCKKRDLPRINLSDPIARYYNMQVGQICKVIRPTPTSGYSIIYRVVVRGKITK